MEFRYPIEAAQQNAKAMTYLTQNLSDRDAGRVRVESLIEELGNAIDRYPDWHPLLTLPPRNGSAYVGSLLEVKAYKGLDHTIEFVKGFVTCPYSDDDANRLVEAVNEVPGLYARRLDGPLYADSAFPVVVAALTVELDADGTILGRRALAWFVQQSGGEALSAQVAETWWNVRSNILGSPHGQRSSLFVNQHTGAHMRKLLEAMNKSGMFGPVKESSLAMLSQKERDTISTTLIRTAVKKWDKESASFTFEMCGETCEASVRDTWGDDTELSVSVKIGNFDLYVSGFLYPKDGKITHLEPRGKRAVAEKFA